MKAIVSMFVLGLLTASTAVHAADQVSPATTSTKVAPQSTQITDPTLAFFVALHACKAGDYQEKNIMTAIVGPAMLKHTINGLDDDDCSVYLQTPDGRVLECTFTETDLEKVSDQHFMVGMLNATADQPSSESQRADAIWTQMKTDSCNFLEK